MTENNAAQILDAIRSAGYRDHPTNIERKRVDAILLAVEPLLSKLRAEGVQAGDDLGKLPAYARSGQGQRCYSLGYARGRKKGNEEARAALASTPVADMGNPISVKSPEFEGIKRAPADERAAISGVTLDGCLETLFCVGEHLGINYAESRKQPGAPSGVYIKAIEDRVSRASNAAREEAAKLMEQTSRSSGAALIRTLASAPVAGEAQITNTEAADFADKHGMYYDMDQSIAGDHARALLAHYAAPQASEAYTYARNLAVTMWEKRFKQDTPEWKPCEDLIGVLTQIDNMVAGLVVPQASEAVRDALWTLTEHNALHFGEQHNTVIQGRAALKTQADKDGAVCSCPTGDGSLRHPCAVHPDCAEAAGETLAPIFQFLLGEGPLRGVEFGDRHPDERGAYWWRKDLRAALSPQKHPRTDGGGHGS